MKADSGLTKAHGRSDALGDGASDWLSFHSRGKIAAGLLFLLSIASLGWSWSPTARNSALPVETREGGFATSDTCRACHPGFYESWRGSYHRTMTQAANPDIMLGDFDEVVLEDRGHTTRFERRGDEIWVDMPDPAWFFDPNPEKIDVPPRIRVPIVMTTGSHHMQYYWIRRPGSGPVYARPDHGSLISIPWVWLIDPGQWVPVQDSFLTPPSHVMEEPPLWNTSCFSCHSVATQPQYSAAKDTFDSRSVELGIACEACHGPGETHVGVNRSPLRRYLRYFGTEDEADPTIVNPRRLEAGKSRDLCGHCHSFGEPLDMEAHQKTGVAFRPGKDLRDTNHVYRYPKSAKEGEEPARRAFMLGENFWPDGTIRVAGREYNGLMESACASEGELTCLSCHSMHGYESPDDQLIAGMNANASCATCHESIAENVSQHTHHDAASTGSECVNCHMPHTTYGLFSAIRSHRIDSPSAENQMKTGRPNACNLCHLDQTLEWTSRQLTAWYGHPETELDDDNRSVASSVLWAVKGNAVQRGLVAWHMSWPPALEASGQKWIGAYLSLLLNDPYVAVRRVAQKSIATRPGFENFEYDFSAESETLLQKRNEAIALWKRNVAGKPDRTGSHLLQNEESEIDRATLNRIFSERNHQAIRISE